MLEPVNWQVAKPEPFFAIFQSLGRVSHIFFGKINKSALVHTGRQLVAHECVSEVFGHT